MGNTLDSLGGGGNNGGSSAAMNGYGPEEGEEASKSFMNRINFEAGAFVCIKMDANSKLGHKIIKKMKRVE